MVRSRVRQQRRWAFRLFVAAAYALVATWSWQLGVVELFEHHDESAEQCPDDGDSPCDCGDNCHCCLLCAHQTSPVVAPAPVEVPQTILASVDLVLLSEQAAPPSVEHARVPKVPKHLS